MSDVGPGYSDSHGREDSDAWYAGSVFGRQGRVAGLRRQFVLAAQLQTRLPLGVEIAAGEERGALLMLPVVGAVVGLAWLVVAWLCSALGLPALASAVVVAAVMMASEGFFFERHAGRAIEGVMKKWRAKEGESLDSEEGAMIRTASMSILLLLRVALLAASLSLGAILASALLSRWVLSLLAFARIKRREELELSELLALALAGLSSLFLGLACIGLAAVLWMLVAGVALAFAGSRVRGLSLAQQLRSVALVALLVELGALL